MTDLAAATTPWRWALAMMNGTTIALRFRDRPRHPLPLTIATTPDANLSPAPALRFSSGASRHPPVGEGVRMD